jgi:hypothetical protein
VTDNSIASPFQGLITGSYRIFNISGDILVLSITDIVLFPVKAFALFGAMTGRRRFCVSGENHTKESPDQNDDDEKLSDSDKQ